MRVPWLRYGGSSMQALSFLAKHASTFTALVAVPIALVSVGPGATAAYATSANAPLVGRVTAWGGLPANGDFRPPTFVVEGTRSQRAFFLSQVDQSSSSLSAMDVDDAAGLYPNLAAIRWLAGHASSDGYQLRDETKEDMAEQLAVWILAGVVTDASATRNRSIRSRAQGLVAESLAASARWTPPRYAQSYEVRIDNPDEHTNTFRFIPKIVAEPPVPLTDTLFTVESEDSSKDQFSVTANSTGVGPTIALRESTSSQVDMLRADIILDPGVIFSGRSGVLVTAQTIPISRSTPVEIPRASLKRISSIFDASLASNLTPAGKGVYWFAVAATVGLSIVGLVRSLAKLAELCHVRTSDDPRAVRRRRKVFLVACVLFIAVLAPFSYVFIKAEFVAYGYSRPGDPQSNEPTSPLRPVQQWATSCFDADELTYTPANITDEDYASAWVSGRDRGAGSLVAFDFGNMVAIHRMSVWNGVQGHGDNFYRNGRVTTLQLLSDGGWVQVASLDPDSVEEQVLDADHELSPIVTRYLVLRVGGINDTYLNAALTEVTFHGHALKDAARPVGISVDPAGLRIAKNADASPRNRACHAR